MRRRLVNARLLSFLLVLRISANLQYGREIPLTELHRRIISQIGNFGGVTSMELVALTGQEKAQISRAVSALSAAGYIARTSLRAPMVLTEAGSALYERTMAVSQARNSAVAAGLSAAELERFSALTEQLTDRAALLLAKEREVTSQMPGLEEEAEERLGCPPMPERLREENRTLPLAKLVSPPLLTLSAYLSRSATIAYRRETGLTQFTWQMLSQIGEHQPISLSQLIALTHRDKSQVGRAVKWLSAAELVARQPESRRREVVLRCTDAGNALYGEMCESARRRDDFLFADFPGEARRFYIAVLEKLTANAEALLAQERAVAG